MNFTFLTRLSHRLNRQNRRQRLILIVSFGLLILAVLTTSAVATYQYLQRQNTPTLDHNLLALDQEIAFDLNQVDAADTNQFAILLSGYGGPGHQGGFLSDVIQVAHVDLQQQRVSLISIPRDLHLSEGYKINAVLSRGMSQSGQVADGLEQLRQLVSQITGLAIPYFVGIDFVGFKRTIGQELGSIEVQVAQKLDDPWYPLDGAQLDPCGYTEAEIAELTANYSGFALESKFACRYERIHYEPGLIKMEGHDALAYVRSRHSSSDYDRSRRQAEVLTGIRNKLFDLEVLNKLPRFHEAISRHVSTNLDLAAAAQLAPLLVQGREFSINNINLSPENVLRSSTSSSGAFILTPKAGSNNWQEVREFIHQQL